MGNAGIMGFVFTNFQASNFGSLSGDDAGNCGQRDKSVVIYDGKMPSWYLRSGLILDGERIELVQVQLCHKSLDRRPVGLSDIWRKSNNGHPRTGIGGVRFKKSWLRHVESRQSNSRTRRCGDTVTVLYCLSCRSNKALQIKKREHPSNVTPLSTQRPFRITAQTRNGLE